MRTAARSPAGLLALLLATAMLGGCALTRAQVEIGMVPLDAAAPVLEPPPHPVSDGNEPTRLDAADSELWTSITAGRALQDCTYAPGIERWARRIAGSPQRYAAELDRVAPWIDWVWREARCTRWLVAADAGYGAPLRATG